MAETPSQDAEETSRLATAKHVAGTVASYLQVGGSAAASYVKAKASTVMASAASTNENALGSTEILKIAATLDGIFSSGELGAAPDLQVPRLVVVGTQSSGKSSLLNGIIGADILPQGEQMVTRAPLMLQLAHISEASEMRAEVGDYSQHGQWLASQTIPLTCPEPTKEQVGAIRKAIDAQTESRAGDQKGVSPVPIYLKLFSPHMPNLNLVDLPGLTMTALTSQGQPKDIKEQIRSMVSSFIAHPRTIILLVCPARPDLEADPALELTKEHDPRGERTVGVLTKVDLMNQGTEVTRYLTNAVPADLQMRLGYFACKMRGPNDAGLTVREGFASELAYFGAHPSYGRPSAPFADRLGVEKLTAFLSRELLQHMRQHMPEILRKVNEQCASTEMALAELGMAVPVDDASRSGYAMTLASEFVRNFVGALIERRADIKTGRRIKDAFTNLMSEIERIAPFDAEAFPDAYILEAVKDCEGNHLSFPIPPIELLEHMIVHPVKRPVRSLLPPCLLCLGAVHEELRALSETLLQRAPLSRFPKLQARLREEVNKFLDHERTGTQAKIDELISREEAYVYTEDEQFLNQLQVSAQRLVARLDAPTLRSILVAYFATVKRSITNATPKTIMHHMVDSTKTGLYKVLFEALSGAHAAELLDEAPEVETRRRADVELLEKLRAAKRVLEGIA